MLTVSTRTEQWRLDAEEEVLRFCYWEVGRRAVQHPHVCYDADSAPWTSVLEPGEATAGYCSASSCAVPCWQIDDYLHSNNLAFPFLHA